MLTSADNKSEEEGRCEKEEGEEERRGRGGEGEGGRGTYPLFPLASILLLQGRVWYDMQCVGEFYATNEKIRYKKSEIS